MNLNMGDRTATARLIRVRNKAAYELMSEFMV